MVKKADIVMSAASGGLLVLGFPVFNAYFIAWIAIAPLLIALRGKSLKSSFRLGGLTGIIYFIGTIYWVYHSMYYYGGLPLPLSILLMILLSISQALYIAGFSMLFTFITSRSVLPAVLSAPVVWVTLEYVRTYTIFSFPWSMLGYSQHNFLPIIQIADMTGVYGISFLLAASSGMIHDIAVIWTDRSEIAGKALRRLSPLCIMIFLLALAASFYYGHEKLEGKEEGREITVSVIQGNIEQGIKWDSRFRRKVIDTYKKLSIKASIDRPQIIVWPESALPFAFGNDKDQTDEIVAFQKELETHLLFGSIMVKPGKGKESRLSNSALLLSPEGEILSVYDKIHLVPYGEYVPLKELFPFVGKMVAAIGDFARGQETTVMETPFAKIGNLICYEIIFPGLVRKFADSGANVLVTITNDAWFGHTAAPYQHFSMAVFRAVENRAPVVRAANTGISGFIDSRGRIIRESGLFVEDVLTQTVNTGLKKSFYTKYGDVFAYICIVSSLLLFVWGFLTAKRENF